MRNETALWVQRLKAAGSGLTGVHSMVASSVQGSSPAPVGASQYDFFAPAEDDTGGLLEGGEFEGLESGLEEGVEVPPEEEEVEGGLDEDLDLLVGGSRDKEPKPPPAGSHVRSLSDSQAPAWDGLLENAAAAQGPAASSVPSPHSFLTDPIAGPPARIAPPSSNLRSTPSQQEASLLNPSGSLGSVFGGFGVASGPLRQQGHRPLDPWGQPTTGSSLREGHPHGQASHLLQQQPLNWQQQQQHQQPSYQQPPVINSQQAMQWLPRAGGNTLLANRQPNPPPAPSRALTVEELESRMLRSQQRSPQPIPVQQHSDLQRTALLQRHSGSYAQSPTSSRISSFSLPAGIPVAGGLQGIQQGLANASLGGTSGLAVQPSRSPGTQHMLHLSRHSPIASQSFQGLGSGGSVRPHQAGVYDSPRDPRPMGGSDLHNLRQQQQQQHLMWQRQQHMAMQSGGGRGVGRGFGAHFAPGHSPYFRPGFGDNMPAPVMRRRQGSKYMDPEEIESILRIQWKSLHSGAPYVEDYYYQAYVHKHTNGSNKRLFAPDALRDLAPSEKLGAEPAMYVKLEGLGKIAYSNVRRPRPLMDLVTEPPPKEGTSADGDTEDEKPSVKPLEEEPLLAARIVIEDCMCLLMDVDDIDRVWAMSGGMREDEHILRQRRSLLMDAFASSLRLPEGALPPAGTGRASDAVFVRLMGLHKGRGMLARAIKLMTLPLASPAGYAGPAGRRPPPLRIVWAALRNVRMLFSVAGPSSLPAEKEVEKVAAQRMMDATSRIAKSAVDVMRRLESPRAICDCMAALVQGDLASKGSTQPTHADNLLPLTPQGEPVENKMEWLADVVMALLQRARELGLADWAAQRTRPIEGLAVPEGLAWRECFATFFDLLSRHLNTLAEVNRLALEAGAIAAANYAKQIVPITLIRASLPHATEAQRDEIRAILQKLT